MHARVLSMLLLDKASHAICSIVVGRRPFVIAGDPLNMYIAVYMHKKYTWYMMFEYSLVSDAHKRRKSQK